MKWICKINYKFNKLQLLNLYVNYFSNNYYNYSFLVANGPLTN